MTSKVTTLLRAPGVVDAGRVDDAGTERRDPEVPKKAKRRTFTAKYKLEILAEYDAASKLEAPRSELRSESLRYLKLVGFEPPCNERRENFVSTVAPGYRETLYCFVDNVKNVRLIDGQTSLQLTKRVAADTFEHPRTTKLQTKVVRRIRAGVWASRHEIIRWSERRYSAV